VDPKGALTLVRNLRSRIAEEALALVDVPFRHKGRDQRGLDCAGVLAVVRREVLGLRDDFTDYPERPSPAIVMRSLRRFADPIHAKDSGLGDLVLICWNGFATHLGISTQRGIVHADRTRGRVRISTLALLQRAHGIASWYRFKGVPAWPSSR